MGKHYESQEEAIRTVGSWRLGIKTAGGIVKIMLIPKDTVIGLKRLGTLDYLTTKHGWIIRRLQQ